MWHYSGNPGDSNIDAIRFYSQLTDTNDQRLSDEELTFLRTKEDTNIGAAARACETLSAKYAAEVDVKVGSAGEFSIKSSQLSAQFSSIAVTLRREASKHASPWSAGISVSEKLAQEERTDRVEPAFTRDQFGGEGAGQNVSPEWDDEGYR